MRSLTLLAAICVAYLVGCCGETRLEIPPGTAFSRDSQLTHGIPIPVADSLPGNGQEPGLWDTSFSRVRRTLKKGKGKGGGGGYKGGGGGYKGGGYKGKGKGGGGGCYHCGGGGGGWGGWGR